MGSAFHQLCPRYSGTLIPTAPTAIRLWETSTFTYAHRMKICTFDPKSMINEFANSADPDEVAHCTFMKRGETKVSLFLSRRRCETPFPQSFCP